MASSIVLHVNDVICVIVNAAAFVTTIACFYLLTVFQRSFSLVTVLASYFVVLYFCALLLSLRNHFYLEGLHLYNPRLSSTHPHPRPCPPRSPAKSVAQH